MNEPPATLSSSLPGTWLLESRIDVTATRARQVEPSLGDDPIALLFYDRSGHFGAQFMKRDRSLAAPDGPSGAVNNSRAQSGYDAYFGTYTIDDAHGTVTQQPGRPARHPATDQRPGRYGGHPDADLEAGGLR